MFQENTTQTSNFNISDLVRTISTVITLIFSATNLIYAIKFFRYKDKKEDEVKEKDLRVSWFKSLILDYNFEYFNNFFQEIDVELQKLKQKQTTDKQKEQIIETVLDKQRFLRGNFIEMLSVVDGQIYEQTLGKVDKLTDEITETVFDSKVSLTNEQKFEELISQKIIETKIEILKLLFGYKG